MKINRRIFDRIDNINLFSNFGTPLTLGNINHSIVQVASWEHATLEARNALTEFLHNKYPNKYLNWNNTVKDAKDYIESSLLAKLQNYKEQYNLDILFVDCVKWDVLHAFRGFLELPSAE